MDDWFDELDKFVTGADVKNVASKLELSEEAAKALLGFVEEGLDDCEDESGEEDEEFEEKEGK